MSKIKEQPQSYDFGYDFNYANWPADTRVSLVNVPWNSDYRDVWDVQSQAEKDAYFATKEATGFIVEDVTYVKRDQPIRLDIPFNVAMQFNYLIASNPILPVSGDVAKKYYYFITDVMFIAGNTTQFTIQLDIWMTFKDALQIGNSYIERGHIGIANENNFDDNGRTYLTQPEGLDLGGEYMQVARKKDNIMTQSTMDILVISTVELDGNFGTAAAPILNTATGSSSQGMPSGASYYVFKNIADFKILMEKLSEYPWVSQGIISITAIPELQRYNYSSPIHLISIAGIPAFYKLGGPRMDGSRGKYTALYNNWREDAAMKNLLPAKYRHLRKFFTYPYMVIEMTTWGGTPIIIKPESWADANATINEKAALSPPNQRVVIWPRRYNAKANSVIDKVDISYQVVTIGEDGLPVTTNVDTTEYYDDGGEYLDKSTQMTNFPTFAVVNNMAIGYLASNARSIAYSNNSADWSQQRALAGNQTSYDQASGAINTSKNINALEIAGSQGILAHNQQAMLEGLAVNSAVGIIGAAASAGASSAQGGGLPGMGGMIGSVQSLVAGTLNANISLSQGNANMATQNTVSRSSNAAQNNQAGMVRDTNKDLADWAAKGDYSNTIAGINAKVQDAMLTQPSTSGQNGGETFNIVHNAAEVSLRWKLVNDAVIRSIGDYWLQFGYAVNQFAVINTLSVMSKFTYWKLSQTYIVNAPIPENFKQGLRGIFEKGVITWVHPDYIGQTDLGDNVPVDGITL